MLQKRSTGKQKMQVALSKGDEGTGKANLLAGSKVELLYLAPRSSK